MLPFAAMTAVDSVTAERNVLRSVFAVPVSAVDAANAVDCMGCSDDDSRENREILAELTGLPIGLWDLRG
jgi:hypothetical protein